MVVERRSPQRREIDELMAESERLRIESQELMACIYELRARLDQLRRYGPPVTGSPGAG